MKAWNEWWALSLRAAQLGLETQGVIALRLMRLMSQGSRSRIEARRMVTEKVAALAEAQAAAAAAVVKGGKGHRVAKKVLGVYKKRVRANKRRLTRSP
jgi:hypothetical protein